jgi:hypothetical protein
MCPFANNEQAERVGVSASNADTAIRSHADTFLLPQQDTVNNWQSNGS